MNIISALPASTLMSLFLIGLAFVFALIFLFKIEKSHWVVFFLLAWLPFESLVLLYTPIDYFAYVRYSPEILLYGFIVGSWILYIWRRGRLIPKCPLCKWFVVYLLVAVVSLVLNWYSPFVWVLGLRQLLRFALIAFAILFMDYDRKILKIFLWAGFCLIVLEAVLAILQYLAGGRLDAYLFSTSVISIGNTAFLGGVEQFWTPGSRVFATLGRYDRLGSLLLVGIVMMFPWIYILKKPKKKIWYWAFFILLGVVLVLTFSRASWIAVFFGILTIGIVLHRDKRVIAAVVAFVLIIGVYLISFSLTHENVLSITEKPNQTLAERVFEAVSFGAWQGSYEGYGRIFFIINTPRLVVPHAPLFGHGPGRYGSGAAASLLNTDVYDKLHLPFGIQNYYGQIDNNWMAIWGEAGTLGLIAWFGIFITIISLAQKLRRRTRDKEVKALAEGCIGLVVGTMIIGFFGPYYEFRASMFYFWLVVGVVLLFWNEEKGKGNFLN